MRIDVVSLFPEMFAPLLRHGVTGRAVVEGRLQVGIFNPRDYTEQRHGMVDDRPYGGGPGMVMMVQPLREAIRAAREADGRAGRTIYLSPQGRRFDQAYARCLVEDQGHLILVSGRYEGIDERLLDTEIDEELSIGDYVMTGGELAAMVVIDTMARLLPGVLGHEDSAKEDSFADGLLDHAHYTRPPEIDGLPVPEVLLSGDHAAIRDWREKQALGRTWLKRPDLLAGMTLDRRRRELLDEFIDEHQQVSSKANRVNGS